MLEHIWYKGDGEVRHGAHWVALGFWNWQRAALMVVRENSRVWIVGEWRWVGVGKGGRQPLEFSAIVNKEKEKIKK